MRDLYEFSCEDIWRKRSWECCQVLNVEEPGMWVSLCNLQRHGDVLDKDTVGMQTFFRHFLIGGMTSRECFGFFLGADTCKTAGCPLLRPCPA